MPDETIEGVKAVLAIAKVVADPKIRISVPDEVVSGPESPPTPEVLGAVEKVVHSMWPGVPVIPAMGAGGERFAFMRGAGIPSYDVSGAWQDFDDAREHGRDERRGVKSFYESVEFAYRLMKELGGAKSP